MAEETGVSCQQTEVNSIRKKYGMRCKVIPNIGQFTNVVTVCGTQSPLEIKFQLEEGYPVTLPHFVVKNPLLNQHDINEITTDLALKAEQLIGHGMIEALFEAACLLCEGKEMYVVKEAKPTVAKKSKEQRPKQRKNDDVASSKKLPSMKTAEDVISRILWDDNLPTECFIVGYEDRFVGIVERQFVDFSWEDLASVDYDTLAIPRHRIQYFKYKDLIVWEKAKRLDNMFGSTGSNRKITDVIEQYEREHPAEDYYRNHYSDDDDDDDSDDEDVVIKVNDDEDAETQYQRDAYWGPKKRPTHFLCLRITNEEIVESMRRVQQEIIEYDCSYQDSVIPTHKLHLTLACLGLDQQADVDRAVHFLDNVKDDLQERFRPKDSVSVELSGVQHFFHNVLYASVKENAKMSSLVAHLREALKTANIDIRDVFDFTPHVTILKFKKHHQAMANTRYIDARLYDLFADTQFGSQAFDNIYLCKMTSEEDLEKGFYISPNDITFEH